MSHEHEWVSVTDPDTQELLGWACRFRMCSALKDADSDKPSAYSATCRHEWTVFRDGFGNTIYRTCENCGKRVDKSDGGYWMEQPITITPVREKKKETVMTEPSDYLKAERASNHSAASVVLLNRKDRRIAEFNRSRKVLLTSLPLPFLGIGGLVGVSVMFDYGIVGWATVIVGTLVSLLTIVMGSAFIHAVSTKVSRDGVEDAITAYSAHMMIDPITYKGSANPKE